ncbi:Remorin family protein [Perilla frutescens var. hirtella]|uniref:Remorin family protein n=1 Tax=Perilla frutescens var. hirtella TaxID=608512 RepID=A0AAD4NWU1_PERFH|nr:Remorin family protein [Perilla frutescens var. hirtella]
MESLIKQTRSRFGGSKEDRSSSSTADKKIPPQKTQSFREKKKSQGWVKKQLPRQMSWEYDFSSSEYPTAVAAAAYAIQSLEESNSWDKKERDYGTDKSLSKKKSRVDETEEQPEPLKSVLRSSDETSRSSFKDDGSTSTSKRLPDKKPTKKISFADMEEVSNNKAEKLPVQKVPSLNRPPSFAEQLNMAALPKPERQPTITQPFQSARTPGPQDSVADAWEKEEMASIKERYEKLRATIDEWELKKKKKAKRKTERIEAELDKRKAKALKKYNSAMARIESVAGGARSQAEENRRNEEFKVKEKANKIRATGKVPATCLCF